MLRRLFLRSPVGKLIINYIPLKKQLLNFELRV